MKKNVIVLMGAMLLAAAPMFAAVDSFLRIDGIDGGSKDPAHRGWIELQNVDLSALQSPRDIASGQASGKRQYKPITVVKQWGPASPQLSQAALSGRQFTSAVLEVAGRRYDLQGITIQGVQKQTTTGDTHELERVSFTFAKISQNYDPGAAMSDNWGNGKPKQHSNGTVAFTGGVLSQALIQNVQLIGPTQAAVLLCEPPDPALNGLRLAFQAKRRLPNLSLMAQDSAGSQRLPAVQFDFTDALVTGMAPAPGGCTEISLHFTKFTGPVSGFHKFK